MLTSLCLTLLNKKYQFGNKTFRDSPKFTWDSSFVEGLGPRDAIEIKPKSNTALVKRFNFVISQPKHMLWVLKRTVWMRQFF